MPIRQVGHFTVRGFVTADLSDPAAPLFRERKSAGGATGEAHRGGDVIVDARELNAGAREP